MASISDRLLAPDRQLGPDALVREWRWQKITVKLEGLARFASAKNLLSKVRGSWGQALMVGASDAALSGAACDWDPPCALDVFFGPKPHITIGKVHNALPKPYVLSVKPSGHDIVIQLSIFGFACEWAQIAGQCLVDAVRKRLDWHVLDKKLFLPAERKILQYKNLEVTGIAVPDTPDEVAIRFITPMDIERGDIADDPQTFFYRLTRRIEGMARWQGAELQWDWDAVLTAWYALDREWIRVDPSIVSRRRSLRQDMTYANAGRRATLALRGDLTDIWPLLLIGQLLHVGRGAVAGLGRFELVNWDAVAVES